MPVIDMPVNELFTYEGKNPKPVDFDAYWDEAKAEVAALGTNCELVPAAFQVPGIECFDLWFTGVKGSRVYAKYLRPNGQKQCPALLEFHGYAGSSGADWSHKLAYVQQGFCVAALDCRGQGGLSADSTAVQGGTTLRGHIVRGLDSSDPTDLAYRQMFCDTVQLAHIVAAFPEVDNQRMGARGGSQGGALTLACAALAPELIQRCAPMYPFLCDYQRVWEMDLDQHAYEELRYFFRSFDPQHTRAVEIFTRLGYVDCQHLASRITATTMMATGLMDTICPPSTQFAAYNKITAEKSVEFYPDFGHEMLPGFDDKVMAFMLGL